MANEISQKHPLDDFIAEAEDDLNWYTKKYEKAKAKYDALVKTRAATVEVREP